MIIYLKNKSWYFISLKKIVILLSWLKPVSLKHYFISFIKKIICIMYCTAINLNIIYIYISLTIVKLICVSNWILLRKCVHKKKKYILTTMIIIIIEYISTTWWRLLKWSQQRCVMCECLFYNTSAFLYFF